jgi:hypothetical protein
MEYQEDIEGEETREKVKVPAQRHRPSYEEEGIPGEPVEPKVWVKPRRWYIY